MPYDAQGVLFTFAMRETYETLKQAKPLDIPAAVDKTLTHLVLNTRDVDVAKISPFYQEQDDPWFTAFALMGQYDQLGQFTLKYNDLQDLYQKYKDYQAAKNWDMATYYNTHYDFTPLEQKMDVSVFRSRQEDIKNFARNFSNSSYSFLSKVIVPLQTDAVPNADVSSYLDAHLSGEGLPKGLTPEQLKAVIMKTIATPEEFLAEAETINPSLGNEIINAVIAPSELIAKNHSGEATKEIIEAFNEAKIMSEQEVGAGSILFRTTGKVVQGTGLPDTLEKLFALFRYTLPSTYIRMIMNFSEGKVTHAQVNQALAESLAAEALDKRLAQIADGLFEMERIFAFPTANVGDDTIYPNWQKLALNDVYSPFMVARLAADNVMKSGKTQYQTNALAGMQLKNRKMENAKINSEVLLFSVDFLPLLGSLNAAGIDQQLADKAQRAVRQAKKEAARAARTAKRAEKENALVTKRRLQSSQIRGSKDVGQKVFTWRDNSPLFQKRLQGIRNEVPMQTNVFKGGVWNLEDTQAKKLLDCLEDFLKDPKKTEHKTLEKLKSLLIKPGEEKSVKYLEKILKNPADMDSFITKLEKVYKTLRENPDISGSSFYIYLRGEQQFWVELALKDMQRGATSAVIQLLGKTEIPLLSKNGKLIYLWKIGTKLEYHNLQELQDYAKIIWKDIKTAINDTHKFPEEFGINKAWLRITEAGEIQKGELTHIHIEVELTNTMLGINYNIPVKALGTPISKLPDGPIYMLLP